MLHDTGKKKKIGHSLNRRSQKNIYSIGSCFYQCAFGLCVRGTRALRQSDELRAYGGRQTQVFVAVARFVFGGRAAQPTDISEKNNGGKARTLKL